MSAVETRSVELPGGFAANATFVRGEGSPLVYLHGPFGQEWLPFLDDLAAHRRVHAPAHPGAAEPEDLRHLDGIFDLMLYYDDLFASLGLGRIDLVGHSFGGMVAAELAATFPDRVRKLVLIDAFGLWRDDAPIADHVMTTPEKQVALLYADPSNPEVAARLAVPDDVEQRITTVVRRFSAVASTSHFIWPIPERGLAKRLRRVKAETLVVWGREDALVPPVYAGEFAERIPSARILWVDGAGHVPQIERREIVSKAVLGFLG